MRVNLSGDAGAYRQQRAGLWVSRPKDGEALRRIFGLPIEDSQLTGIHFDATTAVFMIVFIMGLAMVAFAAGRCASAPIASSPDQEP